MGKESEWYFFQNGTHMANRYMERCSTSLVIREMQIKTTMRQCLMPVRMAMPKKTRDNKCWQVCGKFLCVLLVGL